MEEKLYVFIKDFIYGTELLEMNTESYFELIKDWNEGLDIPANNRTILNKNVESIYIRKFR